MSSMKSRAVLNEEALAVYCPQCGVEAGEVCIVRRHREDIEQFGGPEFGPAGFSHTARIAVETDGAVYGYSIPPRSKTAPPHWRGAR